MNSESFVSSLLDQSSYVVLNEGFIRMLSGDCTTAVLLARLISLHKYFREQNSLTDNWFFQTVKDIEVKLGINGYHQRRSFSKLEEMGLLKTKLVGSPPIRYFKLDFNNIEHAFMKEVPVIKKVKKSSDKSSFYSTLNSNDNWFRVPEVSGNIPKNMAEFMFVFKKVLGHSFAGWNPENYGILVRYMDKVYFKIHRPFDFSRLKSWSKEEGPKNVKNFIKYDQTAPEYFGNMTIEEFLKELK